MNTRKLAAQVIVRVVTDGQSLTNALQHALPSLKNPQEQGFVQALCYGVCRHYHHLDFILAQLLDKPLKDKDADIKALALVGLYQLSFMRVKDHAAVAETVQAAKHKLWAKALLNAVLRRYLREKSSLEQRVHESKVAALSHPQWLIERIESDWQADALAILTANNAPPPLVLRVNSQQISREQYIDLLSAQNIAAVSLAHCPTALEITHPVPVSALPLFAQGKVCVQDSAAQHAAPLLELQVGQRVLDLCAAPGGKTTHILQAQPLLKEVVAVDNDPQRLLRVAENMQRAQVSATLIHADAAAPANWWDGVLFERILLDAPCSALGVIRRHPDIKLLRRPEDIAELVALQQNLLAAAWQLLAPAGLLLYVSCSILKQENEYQIEQFLTTHADAQEIKIAATWGIARPFGRQILTGQAGQDGFYYAKLKKCAG